MADAGPEPSSADNSQQDPPSLRHKTASVNMSNLRVVNTSPRNDPQPVPQTPPPHGLASPLTLGPVNNAAPVGPSLGRPLSPIASPAPASVFDIADGEGTEPTTAQGSEEQDFAKSSNAYEDDTDSYNLKPPPPSVTHDNVEALALRFFSVDHLDTILRDYSLASRFAQFLEQYRPQHAETLKQYTEFKKAIAAVEYANAIARRVKPRGENAGIHAAKLDEHFEVRSKKMVEDLVEEALPAYLTHRLVSLVTDTLVKEITGNSAPLLTELIPSLAEVYCITDPSLPDNPIVYASEEFYNTTQYGQEYVIGRNCRFLQGPRTSTAAVRRLIECLSRGEESCETILNYRRDGSPFMNLLLLAPMYDNKGTVRYFLGCQIDVSQLLYGGRGLESFAQLLSQDRSRSRFGNNPSRGPKQALRDLGQLLTEEEADIVKNRVAHPGSAEPQTPGSVSSSIRRSGSKSKRVVLGMDDEPGKDPQMWPSASLGHSGRLPGVYQNYLLVRPYPSLRITFTSPALRIPGLLQTKFLDRIGGPSRVREGLMDALSKGTGVTAKVTWLSNNHSDTGRPRWIHCTPLLGSDERVGVWMIVMVENEPVTGSLNRQHTSSSVGAGTRTGAQQYTSNKLYADYLKRESRPGTQESRPTTGSTEHDDQFRDF